MDIRAYSVPPETSKRCFQCKGLFHKFDFTKDLSKKDGLSIYCNLCKRRRLKEYRAKTPEKQKAYKRKYYSPDKSRDYLLRMRYGITLLQFEELFNAQDRKCKLCKSDKTDNKNFVVDHCHKTGKIRGILCSYCNRALGMFKDDKELLMEAIRYLGDF